jgi:hypothetical protein
MVEGVDASVFRFPSGLSRSINQWILEKIFSEAKAQLRKYSQISSLQAL